jgi:prepilin signal peptidase PulO-like enzyme (type II secretory pathway)
MCPHCSHQLAAKDLVPVVSWAYLRGKCRYCRKPIGVQYPIVELITSILFAVSYVAWPYTLENVYQALVFGVWLLLVTGFVAHGLYDIKWYTLLDKVTVPLTVLGAVFAVSYALTYQDIGYLVGPAIGAVILFGLFYVLFQLSDGAWIGGGDVKLAPLLGGLAGGVLEMTLLLFMASVAGTLYALLAAVKKRESLRATTRIPFGPFLLGATFITVVWGSTILDWYTSLIVVH